MIWPLDIDQLPPNTGGLTLLLDSCGGTSGIDKKLSHASGFFLFGGVMRQWVRGFGVSLIHGVMRTLVMVFIGINELGCQTRNDMQISLLGLH
jgi:hypothetical protein